MAIPVLNHLDFRYAAEAQNLILHKTTEGSATNTEGAIIYDTGTDTVKYRNASAWVNLARVITAGGNTIDNDETLAFTAGTGITIAESGGAVTITNSAAAGSSFGTVVVSGQSDVVADQANDTLTLVAAGGMTITQVAGTDTITLTSADTTTNTMGSGFVIEDDDGTEVTITENKEMKIIGAGGLTTNWTDVSTGSDGDPYDLTLTIGTLNQDTTGEAGSVEYDLTVDNTTIQLNSGTTYDGSAARTISGKTAAIANGGTGLATADQIHTFVTGQTDITAADTAGNAGTATLASTVTITDKSDNVNYDVLFGNSTSAVYDDTGALYYNPSTGILRVPNLTVAGTTTQVNTVTMNAQNAVVFEGATADEYETTLSIVDPTADHTQYLINQGGYIPVLAASTTTAITSTPAELNTLAGFNGDVTDLNYAKTLYDTGVTGTEFDYLDGVTSAIQAQFGGKQPLDAELTELATMASGTAGALADLSAAEVAILDDATLSTTELNYVDGVTSAIQTQLDAKQSAANVGTLIDARSVVATIDSSAMAATSGMRAEIRHNLGTEDITVELFEKTSKTTVWAEVKREEYDGTDSTNYITVYFASEPDEDIEVIIYSHDGATAAAAVAYA